MFGLQKKKLVTFQLILFIAGLFATVTMFTVPAPKVHAQTVTCQLYTLGERPQSTCNDIQRRTANACTLFKTTADGGRWTTRCYNPDYWTCNTRLADGSSRVVDESSCVQKSGTQFPPVCSVPQANGTTCTLSQANAPPAAPSQTPGQQQLGSIQRDTDKAFGGCSETTGSGTTADACGFIDKYINPLINFLSALVGMVVVIMLIIGGIQYSSAGGDPAKVTAAKGKIMNALIALLAFFFLYAGIQWLVPGGIF
jgi:hypothetical protein